MNQLDKPRIRVDFNEVVEQDVVLLSKEDEAKDSSGERIVMREGLRVHVYMEDADENGKATYLIASGIAERNCTDDWSANVKWRVRIDEWGELER